ncbi:MAG TPA: cation diffusion facilitator family transporter [Vicinamibacterales bacterium]|nr:cation diffusion facilitator family transporter [Vicinamibacterales bacterium]
MAPAHSSGVLNGDRYSQVTRVLYRVLFLNFAVALIKIGLGITTGAVSILSDGFHSVTDGASNVVALIGVSIARRPPDANHPYGHRKYETMASVGILLFLILVVFEVVVSAFDRMRRRAAPDVFPAGIGLMAATVIVNLLVVTYETRASRRLKSELLLADAKHTRSDVLTSVTVLAALLGVQAGYPILDPLAALLVAGFIGHACWQIAQVASRILSDEVVIAEDDVRDVVQSVPEVIGCHRIRTRGSADHVFLDLHIWLDGRTPLQQAHATSHVVKDRLMARYPQIVDVVIHIEPPPTA